MKDITGINNPNFGKKWSDEKKLAASIKRKQMYAENPEYRKSVGKSNRGKKFGQELIAKMHAGRSPESYGHQGNLTDETRKIISEQSVSRFQDPAFKEKYRKIMENNGVWIPLELKTDFELYYKDADWICNMFEYMSEEDLLKIKEIGIFNAKINKGGLVRDHIISRVTGFNYDIPAILMRHPANMQIIPHSSNARKGHEDKKLNEDQNEELISALIAKIQKYDKQWIEQEKCYDCIRMFRFTSGSP